ncbi:hypothetical protein LAZ67_5003381 [Cordylochernes scorpioides]|uniref:Uncharacterized protein n=1 Tax=Cordylochernes scorpioides TaxID=51811 RepID=A0ABY6KH97_9ARAC|nr:hypothetical protein LAZ67_5003381 [Cordylochernes scorpioides]
MPDHIRQGRRGRSLQRLMALKYYHTLRMSLMSDYGLFDGTWHFGDVDTVDGAVCSDFFVFKPESCDSDIRGSASLPHIGGWAILARNRVYCAGGVDGIVGCVCFGDGIPEEGSKIGGAVEINLDTIWAKNSGNGNGERGIGEIANGSINRGGPRSSGIKRVFVYEISWVSCSG